LSAGNYNGFNVSSYTCLSNTIGPVTLKDPNPPPVPKLSSNSPICSGKTLALDATDAISGLAYDWSGPNGFSSNERNPDVSNVSMADSGLYTLTIRFLNCPTAASENIIVYPPVVLKDVTANQVIPFGSSITLNASGAEFYLWAPNDGTLSNPNINNPVATPQQTTTYIVEAMNKWGCVDSAEVTISLDNNTVEGVPNAFTPNGDGKNDVFMIQNIKYDKLVDFSVYNRWGQLIYHNTYDVKQGWDGTFNGVPQDMGTYDYRIILSDPDGKLKYFKGSVTLIR
jgi:gliding motility-associated-like protein